MNLTKNRGSSNFGRVNENDSIRKMIVSIAINMNKGSCFIFPDGTWRLGRIPRVVLCSQRRSAGNYHTIPYLGNAGSL